MFDVGACVQGLSRNYIVLGEHASGGMSRTFRARAVDRSAGDTIVAGAEADVLLKVTSFAGMRDWRAFERFEREVRTLSSLSHPRIPKSIELFAWDGTAALEPERVAAGETPVALVHVQELVAGRSLSAALKAGARFSAEELTTLYRELLETLSYLHGLLPPVLHRDLQPRNIILDPAGHPHLVDFGLSLEADATTHSVSLGAPGYVAPELVLGIAGPKADIYALAATILTAASHMSATEFPREAKTGKILVQKASPGLPQSLARTLERSLELDLRKRTATAKDVLASLSARRSLASRVSLGKSRGRIAALGALGFALTVLLPVGFGIRAHYKHKAALEAEKTLPSETSELEAAMGCSARSNKAETEGEAAPATPAPGEPSPASPAEPSNTGRVEWLGRVVETSSEGPRLGARCALSAGATCDLSLECEASPNGTKFFSQTISQDADTDEGCQISQVVDALPEHYRYTLRASAPNEQGDSFFADTTKRLVRVQSRDKGSVRTIRLQLERDVSEPTSNALLSSPTTISEPVRLRGTVQGVSGNAPVPFGGACTATIDPVASTTSNCRVRVSCGGQDVYRNDDASCTMIGGAFGSFSDHWPSILDHTPRASIEGNKIKISDETAEGNWAVSMEMNLDK